MAKKKGKELKILKKSFVQEHPETIVLVVSIIVGTIFFAIFYLDYKGDMDSRYTETDVADPSNKTLVKEAKEEKRMDGDYTYKVETANGILEISWIDYLVFAVTACFAPFGIYKSGAIKRKRAMEAKFPDFMRDLAEFWKGGLSMTLAVDTLSKGEYGALDDEVEKMAQQLSWGVAFNEVMDQFSKRMRSGLVERSIALIEEANKAGGEISDILLTVSNDARELKVMDREKEGVMQSYILIIVPAFLIYTLIIASMTVVFVPAISSSTEDIDLSSTSFGGVSIRELEPALVALIFFYSVMVQALGGGLNAGIMGKGTISDGLKWAAYFLVIGWLIFEVLAVLADVRLGVI